jgi:hypothetical protein
MNQHSSPGPVRACPLSIYVYDELYYHKDVHTAYRKKDRENTELVQLSSTAAAPVCGMSPPVVQVVWFGNIAHIFSGKGLPHRKYCMPPR